MRAVAQRVKSASVSCGGHLISSIGRGLLILLGIDEGDGNADLSYICDKIIGLRVFDDQSGNMNLSVADIGGEVLIVSQFTLYGDCRKGRRPSFIRAARPDRALSMYEAAIQRIGEFVPTKCGRFGAMMEVSLINDGPVTILLDSERSF